MQKFANQHGYSDTYPFEVTKVVSEKTVEVRRMAAELDPTWKPEIIIGGFVGHTVNNHDQRWTYDSIEDAPTVRIRKHKNGRWFDKHGNRYVFADQPKRFYDYNF